MTKRNAFTLVELLVVIAIISLLIAILAPSLKAAKDLARSTFCMTNLNALNKSVFVYSENNRGYMMVYVHKWYGDEIRAPDNTYKSYVCFRGYGTNPTTGLFSDVRGFGLVYVAGLLGPAELFYCPDQKDERSTIEHYPKPWGSACGEGSDFIRNGYMWNPWVKQASTGVADEWTYEDKLLLERHPNEWFLTSDLLDRELTLSHVFGEAARWNLGFADGRAATWEGKELYKKLLSGVDAGNDWNIYNSVIRPLLPGSDIEAPSR